MTVDLITRRWTSPVVGRVFAATKEGRKERTKKGKKERKKGKKRRYERKKIRKERKERRVMSY